MDTTRVCTVTSKKHCAVLPAASVAVYETRERPAGKFVPEGGEAVTVGSETASETSTGSYVTGVPADDSVDACTSAGHVRVGGVVSSTMTRNVHVAVLPEASVAVAVTVVLPSGKVLPLGGE
jgi:hypothetical protein